MATSLIGGLLSASASPEQVLVAEPDANKCKQLHSRFGIDTTTDNAQTLAKDVVMLAVKPQILQKICRGIASSMNTQTPLFISIAAGVRSQDINRWLGGGRAIVRCMPNTPSLLQCGATAMYANEMVTEPQKKLAQQILLSVGIALWVTDENDLDAVTALSGSGPAYYFLMMEAMQQAGEQLGLDKKTSMELTLQTALGAARMASEMANKNNTEPSTLRAQVTSKGGTTEQAIKSFAQSGFRGSVVNAILAAHKRSISLADELAKDQS